MNPVEGNLVSLRCSPVTLRVSSVEYWTKGLRREAEHDVVLHTWPVG